MEEKRPLVGRRQHTSYSDLSARRQTCPPGIISLVVPLLADASWTSQSRRPSSEPQVPIHSQLHKAMAISFLLRNLGTSGWNLSLHWSAILLPAMLKGWKMNYYRSLKKPKNGSRNLIMDCPPTETTQTIFWHIFFIFFHFLLNKKSWWRRGTQTQRHIAVVIHEILNDETMTGAYILSSKVLLRPRRKQTLETKSYYFNQCIW